MQSTTKGNRLHVGFFGRRNAGKSSLINAITKQETALVSEVAGTTTDPVYKAMELLPLGPIVLIDTAGIDDMGALGRMRIEKTMEVIKKTDVAILVLDAAGKWGEFEESLFNEFKKKRIPILVALNKCDTVDAAALLTQLSAKAPTAAVSAVKKIGLEELKRLLVAAVPADWAGPTLLEGLVEAGDFVVLVTPIDSAAPKGRLILPQVQAIRDIIDHNAQALVVKENALSKTLAALKMPPKLVITDSQVFQQVNEVTPASIQLTSFSILMARYKGDLKTLIDGAAAVDLLQSGDKVLIAEACTHQCQSDDIGRVKIPRWLNGYIGGELDYHWVNGNCFPADLASFKLVIHCGACMLNRQAMLNRLTDAAVKGIPVVNYGILIAKIKGILPRALSPFGELGCADKA